MAGGSLLFRALTTGVAALSLVTAAKAAPYASCITNDNGTVYFYMNEAGATVNVVFEDNTTNAMGVLPSGRTNFSLGSHTSYQIIAHKAAFGTPALISSDSAPLSTFNASRGVDVNKNPKNANYFGRVYTGNAGVSATRQWGIYCVSPDMRTNLFFPATATNAMAAATNSGGVYYGQWAPDANAGNTSGPYRLTIAPDDSVYVTDYGTPGATLWQFGANFEYTNLVLAPVGENQGIAAGTHGDPIGVFTTGSIAEGNLVVYTADPGLGAPATAQLGDNTAPGSWNNLFRYDIGAGPLPWTNAPNFAVNLGLPGFFDSQICDVTVNTNNGYLYGMFRRLNFSDGNIQVFDPAGHRLYTSLKGDAPNQTDLFQNAYGGVRISPDGQFLATVRIDNIILICNLTNGIPDENSIVTIANTPATANSRGIAWDAADNLYVCSSGQGRIRAYSLGLTSTTITSNDYTGTNGSFTLTLPNVHATVSVAQDASQNYINDPVPGTPIPGIFRIQLDQPVLPEPVAVAFSRSGTAAYPANYNYNLGTNADGVLITTTNVIFPAGAFPGGGNWYADLQVIPTATPVSGPTLTAGVRLSGGGNYAAGTPFNATLSIFNTGPQFLVLSSAASGATFSRGVTNDFALFTITRYGDLNGPGNSPGNVTAKSFTVTNFTRLGTAVFPVDYTAGPQRVVAGSVPTDGQPGVVINAGEVTVTARIGNPVAHANLSLAPTNVTIILNLTNASTGTNLTSAEGYTYYSSNTVVTLTELDNTVGPEVVLWSNPLIDPLDSTNWTVTYASTNLASTPVLPVVVPNYTNGATSVYYGGTNDFDVQFGYPVDNDLISPSPFMAANGWTNVLRMTVNKGAGSSSGVNVLPQGLNFKGNYALRFNMYLSLLQIARGNPNIGTFSREFAAFGINHKGTNCDWRLPAPITAGTGASPTNADGIWFAIDAGTGSLTPADFDGFTSPALPNAGVSADLVSNSAQSQSGVFKNPPFTANQTAGGGNPVNQWVDVSVEVTKQTNVTLLINRSQVLTSFSTTNGGNYTNGTIMLGYLDPYADVSDSSAFVYYSNVRVVELSPFISAQPVSLITTQGATASLVSSATYATAPLTNTWFFGNTAPAVSVQADSINDTNLTSTLTLTNLQAGTNYFAVFSDLAGSVTSYVASVEVILGPTNVIANQGSTVQFTVTPSGPSAPTSYQWKLNGNNLANNSHYAGVTTATLTITNVQAADMGTYSVAVVNPAGTVTPSATLQLVQPPSFTGVSLSGSDVVLTFSTLNTFDTISSYVLQSSPVVTGPYTNTPGTFSVTGPGTFQVTAPQVPGEPTFFYRLLHVP